MDHDRRPPRPRRRRPSASVLTVGGLAVVALLLAVPASAGAHDVRRSSQSGSSSGRWTDVVRPGDTVGAMARRNGVPADAIRAANGIVDDRLYAGARLVIDPSAAAGRSTSRSSGASSGGTYVVRRGDVLSIIARRHGVRLADLLAANGLSIRSVIHPGQRLAVPGSPGGGTSSSGTSSGSPGSSGPRILCPVVGGTYMNDWGFPRGATRAHQGTDLFARRGTPVAAPITGTLTFSSNGLGGRTFTIVSPSGWVAYGAHLDSLVGSSRWVAAGELVGTVGDSGNAKGGPTHLHLGLRKGAGSWVNPYPSVRAAC